MAITTPFLAGFKVTGAHHVTVDLRLSPAGGTATVSAKFLKSLAIQNNSMSASVTRTLGAGQEFSSISVSDRTMGTRDILFNQRVVSYSVTDRYENGAWWRVLTVSVRSLDASGNNEPWRLELSIDEPPDTLSDFIIQSGTPTAVIGGILATP